MASGRSSKITESTLIPIGLAIVVIGGAAAWVTKTTYQLSDHGERLERIEKTSEQVRDDVVEIKSKLRGDSDGLGFPKRPNFERSSPGPESENVQDLHRRLKEYRTDHEADSGTPVYRGTEKDLDDRAEPRRGYSRRI